jgi:glycerol kinase
MQGSHVFQPSISEDERVTRVKEWKKAIQRSLDWVERD